MKNGSKSSPAWPETTRQAVEPLVPALEVAPPVAGAAVEVEPLEIYGKIDDFLRNPRVFLGILLRIHGILLRMPWLRWLIWLMFFSDALDFFDI